MQGGVPCTGGKLQPCPLAVRAQAKPADVRINCLITFFKLDIFAPRVKIRRVQGRTTEFETTVRFFWRDVNGNYRELSQFSGNCAKARAKPNASVAV
jgi:hypothetical protein